MRTTIFTSSFLITKLLLVFVIAEPRFHHTLQLQHREIEERDAIGCQKALGPGGLVCGDSTSKMCYDPTIGESCCPLDDSYCSKDQYCAPVAGFCCNAGEDVIDCGIRQGFVPPPSESESESDSVSASEILPPTEPITVPIPTAAAPISIALEPIPHVSLHLSVPPVNLVFSASQNPIEATSSSSSPVEATPSPVSTGLATSHSTSIRHVSIVLPSVPPVNLVFSSTQKPTATLESISIGLVHPSSTTTIVEQVTSIVSCGGIEKPSSSPVSSPQGSATTPASPQYTGTASSSLGVSAVVGLLGFLIAALLFV